MKSLTILGNRKNFGFANAETNLTRLAGQLRGRNRAVFFAQLLFAVWLVAAKITATAAQRKQPKDSAGKKKASPIDTLFAKLHRRYPTLPRRRMLDSWCECLLGALAENGVITLPPRTEEMKQPKPDLKQLRQVKESHLQTIVDASESMGVLKDELFPEEEKEAADAGEEELLDRTYHYLTTNPMLSDEQMVKLRAIKETAEAILSSVGASPTDGKPSALSTVLGAPLPASAPVVAPPPVAIPGFRRAHTRVKAPTGKNGHELTGGGDTLPLPFPPN